LILDSTLIGQLDFAQLDRPILQVRFLGRQTNDYWDPAVKASHRWRCIVQDKACQNLLDAQVCITSK